MWHVHTRFWWGDLTERKHLEDLGIDAMIILIYKTGWEHGVCV